MKAWEIRNGHLSLRELTPPRPGPADTIIRIRHTGICGSDLPKLLAPARFSLPHPWRPGHEIVGTDPTGRTVAVDPLLPCHTCTRCAEGDTHLCPALQRLGWDLPGGFAELILVPSSNLHPLPPRTDAAVGVLADPAAVAVHGLRCAPLPPPGRLAVIGAGAIGLLTALYAHEQGWRVTVLHREGRAPSPGIAAALPAEFRPPSTTSSKVFDAVVDAASGTEAIPLTLALQIVRDGGTIVVQNAYHPGVALPVPLRDLFRRSIRLIGSFSYCRRSLGDFPLGLALLGENTDVVQHVVTEAGGLGDLADVLNSEPTHTGRRVLAVE